LLRGGVPFHIAFKGVLDLYDDERYAIEIILMELDGADFDWNRMRPREKK